MWGAVGGGRRGVPTVLRALLGFVPVFRLNFGVPRAALSRECAGGVQRSAGAAQPVARWIRVARWSAQRAGQKL